MKRVFMCVHLSVGGGGEDANIKCYPQACPDLDFHLQLNKVTEVS